MPDTDTPDADGSNSATSSRRVLVTGAAGFVGSHLVQRLLRDGYEVTGLDIDPGRRPTPEGVEVIAADIRDEAALARAFAAVRPHTVFHLAAQISVPASMRDPIADIEANVIGTVRLAQAAVAAGAQRLVFFSTGGALYGDPEVVPVDESMEPAPASVYGASKLAAERYLELICGAGGVKCSVLRPANVYGPGQDPEGEAGVIAIFARQMLRNEPVTIFGDGSQVRDYVFVEDVTDAALLAATGDPATCLIGRGEGTSTLDLYRRLASLCGYEREPLFADERPGDIARITVSTALARETWGWAPRVTLDDGLAATVEWFRERD